jgi:hypothetical protein
MASGATDMHAAQLLQRGWRLTTVMHPSVDMLLRFMFLKLSPSPEPSALTST